MDYLINDKIRVRNLLIINEAGEKLGLMTNQEALIKARELGLDLVLISPNAPTPVAKIMNFGKFQYELKKREKKSRQNHVEVKVKEVYVKPNIGDHDINWRAENAKKWLAEGNRVKFTVQTYGRLTLYFDQVEIVYKKFLNLIGDSGKPEGELKKINPKNHEVIIVPVKK